MTGAHTLGRQAEQVAARFLERNGYAVLTRNFRHGRREIDLIVRRGDLVAFVEVKARAGSGYGHPLEAITARKRREIEKVARAWVARHGRAGLAYRFDALAVLWRKGGTPVVEHVPGAWRLGE